MTDKERIEQLMTDQHLNNIAFSSKVGMNPATLSNILAGRTNPSLDVLRKIKDAFPELNPTWIFLGEGEMLKPVDEGTPSPSDHSSTVQGDLFSTGSQSSPEFSFGQKSPIQGAASANSQNHNVGSKQTNDPRTAAPTINVNDIVTGVVTQLQKPTRKIVEVRIFFDDGTFETFSAH